MPFALRHNSSALVLFAASYKLSASGFQDKPVVVYMPLIHPHLCEDKQ